MKKTCLVFLRRPGFVLLAMKKRGFGIDKWNGAGGKIEAGETPLQGAVRETQEEIGVHAPDIKLVGRVKFLLADDPDHDHDCDIFVATKWNGNPQETEEMRPKWFAEDAVPYEHMWADDPLWFPLMLEDRLFEGSVTLDGDRIVADDIRVVSHLTKE